MAYADTYRRLLQTLFNHIVLPPRLPQLQDEDLAAVTSALNRHLLVAIRQLRDKGNFYCSYLIIFLTDNP